MTLKGFSEHQIDGAVGPIAFSQAGRGPPALLLHGFPQTRAMWHAIAPELAREYHVICPDLRGYGASAKPQGTAHYTFRNMGHDILTLMDHLDLPQVHLIGHDRGARTAHRLALDAPDRFLSLTLMDIVPTHTLWSRITRDIALGYYHWSFLAQKAPLPERMIGADPDAFFEGCLKSWGPDLPFDAQALAAYRAAWRDKETIRTMCEDYRAGASLDVDIDASDLTTKVALRSLVLFARDGIMDQSFDFAAVWAEKLSDFTAKGMPGGHFFPDHYPQETLAQIRAHLSA